MTSWKILNFIFLVSMKLSYEKAYKKDYAYVKNIINILVGSHGFSHMMFVSEYSLNVKIISCL